MSLSINDICVTMLEDNECDTDFHGYFKDSFGNYYYTWELFNNTYIPGHNSESCEVIPHKTLDTDVSGVCDYRASRYAPDDISDADLISATDINKWGSDVSCDIEDFCEYVRIWKESGYAFTGQILYFMTVICTFRDGEFISACPTKEVFYRRRKTS